MGNGKDSRDINSLLNYYLDQYDEMGATSSNSDFKLETIIRRALVEERERCAMIAENLDDFFTCPMCPRNVADAIRKNK